MKCFFLGAISSRTPWSIPALRKTGMPVAGSNLLVLNAVKHGGQSHGHVDITMQAGEAPGVVQIRIVNQGQFVHDGSATGINRSGLHLISALMPSRGARILREQRGEDVVTVLELESPVISLNT